MIIEARLEEGSSPVIQLTPSKGVFDHPAWVVLIRLCLWCMSLPPDQIPSLPAYTSDLQHDDPAL